MPAFHRLHLYPTHPEDGWTKRVRGFKTATCGSEIIIDEWETSPYSVIWDFRIEISDLRLWNWDLEAASEQERAGGADKKILS